MSSLKTIRLLVADSNEILRMSLAAALEYQDGIQLVGEASDGLEAVRLCVELQPDVVLMGVRLHKLDGISATRLIREQNPEIKVIILTASFASGDEQTALDAGASLYLYKDGGIDEIADAIRSVAR